MARGDKADLFFRKLRSAGLSKPAVQTLAERLDALEAADSAASGAPRLKSFQFFFDTPGLVDGVAVYTPTPGEVLLDAWVTIQTGWDGTTPRGEIYLGSHGAGQGIFGSAGVPAGLHMDAPEGGNTGLSQQSAWLGPLSLFQAAIVPGGTYNAQWVVSGTDVNLSAAAFNAGAGTGIVPGTFATADPVKVVVSQTAAPGGASPGASQGQATLYLLLAVPDPS